MNSTDIGRIGEDIAVKFLRKNKYKILERNKHCSHNEIDIIARYEAYICFVEVKTRRTSEAAKYGRPAAAVSYTKQKRLIAAAEKYLRQNPGCGQPRLDVIEVYLPDGIPEPERAERIVHMPGAFYRR